MRGDGPTASAGSSGARRRIARQGGCAALDFWRARRASVAVETAVVISVLILAAGGLMEIYSSLYTTENMNRAARAAARAVALSPDQQANAGAIGTVACDAIKHELGLNEEFECSPGWTVTVDTGLTTGNLLSGESPEERTGDMVRVTIAWHRQAWTFNAEPSESDATPREVSIGTARSEPGEIEPEVEMVGESS
ncbi:MAG: pilus assembly protein [Defluviicoccus sp.]|nr:pilus assembly protein [Defluviicoccus sp.]MDE0382384.1 pilus assembly protein [Defluviicoccus sp.]